MGRDLVSRPVHPETHLCHQATTLVPFLNALSIADADSLLHLGAIYVNRERTFSDRPLSAGDWVRFHSDPRRFPVDDVNWKATLLFQNPEFVIVQKPAGIPIHPTCDNFVENVLRQCERVLGVPLGITHRLDVGTEGLVLFAKTKDFLRAYNRELQGRRIEKRYRALTRRPPPTGRMVHYMEPGERAPRRVSVEPSNGGKRCELEVLGVKPLPLSDLFESEILLHSGRHHQIRAQLSAEGFPIVGDVLYGSDMVYNASLDALALQCYALGFQAPSGERFHFSIESPFLRFSTLECLNNTQPGEPCHASL